MVKNPLANAGDLRDLSSVPGLGRFPGGGPGNPPQYSCLSRESHEQWSLEIYNLHGHKESDATEVT